MVSEHTRALEEIANDPEGTIGLRGVVKVQMEVPVYRNFIIPKEGEPHPDTDLITEIDAMYTLQNGIMVAQEHKCNDTGPGRDKGTHQLLSGYAGIRNTWHPSYICMIYTYGINPYTAETLRIINDRRHYTVMHGGNYGET